MTDLNYKDGTISGGYRNTASGCYSFIGAGRFNTASALYATVSGGKSNTASACHSAILGGLLDRVCTTFVNKLSAKDLDECAGVGALPSGSFYYNNIYK